MNAAIPAAPLIFEIRENNPPGMRTAQPLTWTMLKDAVATRAAASTAIAVPLREILSVLAIDADAIFRMEVAAPDGFNEVFTSEAQHVQRAAFLELDLRSGEAAFPFVAKFVVPEGKPFPGITSPNRIRITIGDTPPAPLPESFHRIDSPAIAPIIKRNGRKRRHFALDALLAALDATGADCSILARDGMQRTFQSSLVPGGIAFMENRTGAWDMAGAGLPRGMHFKDVCILRAGGHGVALTSAHTLFDNQ